MIDLLEQSLLKKYATLLMNSQFKESIHKNDKWNFRCNICKDSKKSQKKKRGWIQKHKKSNELVFTCYNCGKFYDLKFWFKLYFPDYYRMFMNEYLQMQVSNKKVEIPIIEKKVEIKKERERDKFISLMSNKDIELIKVARDYVKERMIPEDVWKRWFVCTDGVMNRRLIIPFYDKNNEIYFWQGRALYSSMYPKYLNCEKEKDNVIYNIDFIDRSKPVAVTEGIIDSLYIDNCISTLSTNWSQEVQKILDSMKTYLIIDYDSSDDTKRRIEQLIKDGNVLFNWVKFIKDLGLPKRSKWDINSVVCFLNKNIIFNYSDLKKYLTNEWYDWAYFMGGDY